MPKTASFATRWCGTSRRATTWAISCSTVAIVLNLGGSSRCRSRSDRGAPEQPRSGHSAYRLAADPCHQSGSAVRRHERLLRGRATGRGLPVRWVPVSIEVFARSESVHGHRAALTPARRSSLSYPPCHRRCDCQSTACGVAGCCSSSLAVIAFNRAFRHSATRSMAGRPCRRAWDLNPCFVAAVAIDLSLLSCASSGSRLGADLVQASVAFLVADVWRPDERRRLNRSA